jgi:formamidopyrimidine-DNA glycosylase
MPELPEVETIKNELLPQVKDCYVTSVRLFRPEAIHEPSAEEFCRRLPGQGVEDIYRRGKYLLFLLFSGERLILHLRMSGLLLIWPAFFKPEPYTTAVFRLNNRKELHFCDRRKLGVIWLVKDENKVIGKLGPEPLSPYFSPQVLAKLLSRRHAPIKASLCDQSLIAGIGNMYADEALFSARIHPLRRTNSLSSAEIGCLYQSIQKVLQRALESKGASTDTYRRPNGKIGSAHFGFQVAHRGGESCYSCGTLIERVPVRGRGTYFCPNCQHSELQGRLF